MQATCVTSPGRPDTLGRRPSYYTAARRRAHPV